MKSNINVIIAREFRERVVKKSFIITTLLMPVLIIIMMALPALVMEFSTPGKKTMAVVDASGIVYPELEKQAGGLDWLTVVRSPLTADSLIAGGEYDMVLNVNPDVVDNPDKVTLYVHETGSVDLESTVNNAVKDAVETERLKRYDIANLNAILGDVAVDSHLTTLRIDDEGEEKSVSSITSFGIGLVMTLTLYMFLLMYGQLVMSSIIEEKSNRVLELMVSSVKPLQLMLGKILGIGLVAVVQVVIWGILVCCVSAFVLPLLIPEGLADQMALMSAGTFNASTSTFDPDMVKALSLFSSVGYIAKLFIYILFFLVGGFLFYASIFAAIGSAVDNAQDASQLQTFATLPIILALMVAFSVGKDPNTPIALWTSFIPFTSPMVMLARVPFDIPSWQIWVSIVVLFASFVVMAWIAAKIYRVGIFMYGKKPTIKDLIRWARYK